MTIVIGVKTPEAIILGSDSTTTLATPGPNPGTNIVLRLFNSAQKIFEIGPSTPTFVSGFHFSGGIAIYGEFEFGPVSWRGLINSFYREVVANHPNRTDLPEALLAYLQAKWQSLIDSQAVAQGTQIPDTGLIVGYVASETDEVRGASILLRLGQIEPLTTEFFKVPCGNEVVLRLVNGYDESIKSALLARGVSAADFDACTEPAKMPIPFARMPLRDAIDAVHFLIYSTIKLHRYNGATPGIGGPIEIATITPDRGFRWVVHKPHTESIGIQHGSSTT